jgi:DNA-binding NtrC family response regulator
VNGPAWLQADGTPRYAEAAGAGKGAPLRLEPPPLRGPAIVGRSAALRKVLELVVQVAPARATVLVTGETGTGKDLVARAIHDASPRSARAFVPVNCSALPESLLESELFGHTRGSFTGAIANKRGLVEEAAGGTLFLDEISTLPHAVQVKLLRVLQERAIYRVGSTRPVPVDFRLVAATNVDLAAEVRAGRFRADLFYRLNVFPIRVPSLRERRGDIPLLVEHFRVQCARANGVEPPTVCTATMAALVAHDWPGNVRELENFMERAVIMHAGRGGIPVELPGAESAASAEAAMVETALREEWSLALLEQRYIAGVLERAGGHRGRAAAILGIDRRTLYRKLKEYGTADVRPVR